LSFLLDTNVVSEWVKPKPAETVVAWLTAVDEDQVFMSVISFAELRRGVELLNRGRQRTRLEKWIAEDLTRRFQGRLLPVDLVIADAWGHVTARARRAGRPLGVMDAFFGATALAHDLTLATRNVRDFEGLDIALFSPWDPAH
jgi:predicted nucleic acid-binding protein